MVRRILDAAETVLCRIPVEYVTTSRIAKEASLSVSALYRFYQDRQAIFDALASRHMARFREELESQVMQPLERKRKTGTGNFNPIQFLGDVIDAYIGYLEQNPGLRAVTLGQELSAGARVRDASPISGLPAVLRKFLLERVRVPQTPELDLSLLVSSRACESLIALAFEQESRGARDLVIREMKRLLESYLFVRQA